MATLTREQEEIRRPYVERFYAFNQCEARARRAGIPLEVDADSTLEERQAFVRRAIAVDVENGKRANEAIGGPLTREQRIEAADTIPGLAQVSALDVIEQGKRGLRGLDALRAAAAARLSSQPPAPGAAVMAPAHVPAAPQTRSREHRPGGGTRSRSASRDDPSEPEPPLAPRPCEGCGRPFTPSRPDRRHCSAACRVRAHRQRQEGGVATPPVLEAYRDAVARARREGAIDELEALDLLMTPRPRVLERLAGGAA